MNINKTVVSVITVIGLLLMQMVSVNNYKYRVDAERNSLSSPSDTYSLVRTLAGNEYLSLTMSHTNDIENKNIYL